jgi:hypothetical protein
MIHRNARVLLTAAVFLPLLAGLSLAGGSSAAAAPSTLHFFQRSTLYAIVSATGTPLPAEATPAAGDVLEDSDLDYVGNHSHHARNWTASDHVVCSLTNSTGGATCFGEFAIGGSLLFADGVTVSFGQTTDRVALTGGTGAYQGLTGTVTSKEVGNTNNADVTITLH